MGVKELGEFVRRVRESKDPVPTQDALATYIEDQLHIRLSQGWISKVELGEVGNPSSQRIRALAQALHIDARELFARLYDIPFDAANPPPPCAVEEEDPVVLMERIAVLNRRVAELIAHERSRGSTPLRAGG